MAELSTEKPVEWFISEISKVTIKKTDYITFVFGWVDGPVDARGRIPVLNDLRNSVLYHFMLCTGYKDNGGKPDPFKWFKRGMHFHAKPVKKYLGGDLNLVKWGIDYDSITTKSQKQSIPVENMERINRIVAHAPSKEEAIRRMATSDPTLAFTYGFAVGSGVLEA